MELDALPQTTTVVTVFLRRRSVDKTATFSLLAAAAYVGAHDEKIFVVHRCGRARRHSCGFRNRVDRVPCILRRRVPEKGLSVEGVELISCYGIAVGR